MEHSSPLRLKLPESLPAGTTHEQFYPKIVSPVSSLGQGEDRTDSSHRTGSRLGGSIQVLGPDKLDISYIQATNKKGFTTPLIAAVSPASQSHSDDVKGAKSEERRKRTGAISWWWWWEIGAAVLSIISIILIIVVLFKVQNEPLQNWTLPIQPNSLIAVFTTIGRTAMMVPIASCIAQLKWRHFDHRARQLNHLQLFEDATRGPWGAATMLYGVRYQALLASTLALVTVIALGIEPSTQQILSFPHRVTTLSNVSAEIGLADEYVSRAYNESDYGNGYKDMWTFEINILAGMSGTVFQPSLNCPSPAIECSWEDFTTLGVCSDFRNVTNITSSNCTSSAGDLICTYDFPGHLSLSQNLSLAYPKTLFVSVTGNDWLEGEILGSMAIVNVTSPYNSLPYNSSPKQPPTEVYYSTWFWCIQSFHALKTTSSGLGQSSPQIERLTAVEDQQLVGIALSLRANSTGKLYYVDLFSATGIYAYLSTTLNTSVSSYSLDIEHLNFGYYLQSSNLSDVTQDLADTLTGLIRSNVPGDNLNATMFKGEARYSTVFVQVRWPWIILPIVETLLTAVLLAISISLTRHQPLLKTSVIAFLMHGLEGWSDDELEAASPGTVDSLQTIAKGMTASFEEDSRGRLRFTRS